MITTLLKAIAYSKAPRTTFTVFHPAKAVLFRKFQWDIRHAMAPRVTALGAAALALPVGLWLGRRTNGTNGAAAKESDWRGVWRRESADSGPRAAQRTNTGDTAAVDADMQASAEGVSPEAAPRPQASHSTRGGCIDQTAAIGV